MKKRNEKFKIEKGPKEKPLNLGPKPSLKGDFRVLEGIKIERTEARPRGRRRTTRIKISSSHAIFLSLDCNGYHG